MKNSILIVSVIVVIAAVGAGVYFMNRSRGSSSTEGQTTKEVEMKEATSEKMSLKDLLTLGKDQQCTFSYDGPSGNVEGTSFVSSNKVRTDFKGTTEGQSYDGSMILDGEYMYTWTSMMEQGVKMKVTESIQEAVEEAKEDFEKNPNQYIDPDEKLDYNCKGWSADNSKFVPPTNITFMDFSEQIEQFEQSPDIKAAQCAACANLEEEAAVMCKKSLGCE